MSMPNPQEPDRTVPRSPGKTPARAYRAPAPRLSDRVLPLLYPLPGGESAVARSLFRLAFWLALALLALAGVVAPFVLPGALRNLSLASAPKVVTKPPEAVPAAAPKVVTKPLEAVPAPAPKVVTKPLEAVPAPAPKVTAIPEKSDMELYDLGLLPNCVLKVTRVACSRDTEKESFKKCDGRATCLEQKKTGSEAACEKEALKACENLGDRQQYTKSKTVTAKYRGKDIAGGNSVCDENRPDFNNCEIRK